VSEAEKPKIRGARAPPFSFLFFSSDRACPIFLYAAAAAMTRDSNNIFDRACPHGP